MMGQWRILLRQAEEAARGGKFEEAYALAGRPEVADHQQAVQFRGRLGLDLIARAARRAGSDDISGAVEDLHLAERLGAPPDSLAAARLGMADRVADEIRADLDVGEPIRALERIEALARDKISGPALRRFREIAEAWRLATAEARRGEFGEAHENLDRAERLAAGAGAIAAQNAVASARRDLEARQKTAAPMVEALYTALSGGDWPKILAAAEAVVACVPEHPAARQARAKAWQQIAAIGPSSGSQWARRPAEPARVVRTSNPVADPGDEAPPQKGEGECRVFPILGPAAPASRRVDPAPVRPLARASATGPRGRFLLWADAVGGFLVCLEDRIVLGRAGADSPADVPLMGDLSRNHATLVRGSESYMLEPHRDSFVNGRRVNEPTVLRSGDVIRLGSTVELEFRQPSPFSATARLAIISRHRLPIAVDGVLLMADTCIVGPASQAHIPAPTLRDPVVLYRQGASLWCRAKGGFEVDGRPCVSRAPLTLTSSVLGEGFSFSLEPLGSNPV
ncbi:FHA domain-containing protein [Paludisphaera mucosa]|uniref:FHA domain-containing protein n=1 Tax=Paludisphaera mucosa TaxID=3030827 RepID=A0ABT6F7F9_9BACT|nr:FHA domain-containing protein [Paludisphaera mucosa]MDG3003525.1 FHA domain-containing protein [Paludisphaera mucosa]